MFLILVVGIMYSIIKIAIIVRQFSDSLYFANYFIVVDMQTALYIIISNIVFFAILTVCRHNNFFFQLSTYNKKGKCPKRANSR